jgi:hypothetical protein
MGPVEAALLCAALATLFLWAVRAELDKLDDPAYLRQHGIVIVAESALDSRAGPIGQYRGRQIWATVTFKGMVYRFDHVTQPHLRERIGRGQLYLEPGLVYVTT